MTQKLKLQDIDASLTYGQIFTAKVWKSLFIFMYVSCGLVGICIIVMLIGVPLTIGTYSSDDIIVLVCGSISVFILFSLAVLLDKFFKKGKKKATLWLEDAVVLEAYAKSIGQTLHVRNMIMRTATALEVSFEYDDKRCVRQSTYKGKPLYLAVFTKYADRKILITYSPKYDEVMLIKPESAKRYKENNNM